MKVQSVKAGLQGCAICLVWEYSLVRLRISCCMYLEKHRGFQKQPSLLSLCWCFSLDIEIATSVWLKKEKKTTCRIRSSVHIQSVTEVKNLGAKKEPDISVVTVIPGVTAMSLGWQQICKDCKPFCFKGCPSWEFQLLWIRKMLFIRE